MSTVKYKEQLKQSLKDPAEAAAYINAALEDGDTDVLLMALRDVAEAHGMSSTAREAGIGRMGLYKALSETGNPGIKTFTSVLKTFGLTIKIEPRHVA